MLIRLFFFAFLIFNSSLFTLITGNDIKLDLFKYLNDDDIKLLIPKLGTQILFREKLKEFLNTNKAKHNEQTTVSIMQNVENAKDYNISKLINESTCSINDNDSPCPANNIETRKKLIIIVLFISIHIFVL